MYYIQHFDQEVKDMVNATQVDIKRQIWSGPKIQTKAEFMDWLLLLWIYLPYTLFGMFWTALLAVALGVLTGVI